MFRPHFFSEEAFAPPETRDSRDSGASSGLIFEAHYTLFWRDCKRKLNQREKNFTRAHDCLNMIADAPPEVAALRFPQLHEAPD